MQWQAFLENTQELAQAIITLLVSAASILVGLWIIATGLFKMVQYAQGQRQGQPTLAPIAINFVVGVLMLRLAMTAGDVVQMLFGTGIQAPMSAMQYMPEEISGSETMQQALQIGIWWVAAIGWVAVFRGLLLWNDLSKGQSGSENAGWRGLVHVLGGAAAINIGGLVQSLFSG
ncbi:hypothetical protein [Neopusillimonas maritima]|uniref:Uncharacterized protein n=1 Tax=Neopusillimonas maritima TaxID=2026239 RepID=A0A3A1YX14_9BURK|nr:hypothetical protein [Neopusillimonas maritima]MBF22295.1 hypothetical protein [Pusillimonas sp.]RIY41024.1 hypothetical protein CJP73_07710 [Neopusillimonas maritima]|tara:strand:- start:11202 stop:11723 length:522 start_codon:yes stop_codon:yes gene_type:complete